MTDAKGKWTMSREQIAQELVALREAYRMSHEAFAATLTEHFNARGFKSHGQDFVLTEDRLKKWEGGTGPSDRPRETLEQILMSFRQAVDAAVAAPETTEPAPG